MYAVKTDVGITPWVQPARGVPQGGAEGPFLFLLVTLALAFYIRRTYADVAPYPLRTTLLAFADDMAVVTATARQPLPTTPDTTRATKVLHAVTTYLEGNQLLVHNVKSATMDHPTRTAGGGRHTTTIHREPVPRNQRDGPTHNGNRRKPRPRDVHPGRTALIPVVYDLHLCWSDTAFRRLYSALEQHYSKE